MVFPYFDMATYGVEPMFCIVKEVSKNGQKYLRVTTLDLHEDIPFHARNVWLPYSVPSVYAASPYCSELAAEESIKALVEAALLNPIKWRNPSPQSVQLLIDFLNYHGFGEKVPEICAQYFKVKTGKT